MEEWSNQQEYSKRTEKELRKKHLMEMKQHPKSMKVCVWKTMPYDIFINSFTKYIFTCVYVYICLQCNCTSHSHHYC